MSKIFILPENVASKIAAGEVVQRPESVVKELLENSIDAGAKKISLIIKNAGKNFIQVIDDGSGMTKEDALSSLKRHSTSKIKEIQDLEQLNTYGFRGEALYSIASVARLEMRTRDQNSELGTQIVSEGNEIVENTSINCEVGTNITVKNLFYNIPARRKFLKSNSTEFKHIYDTWLRMALAHPEIHFAFIEEEDVIHDLPPSSIEKRLEDFFGENIINNLIAFQRSYEDVGIFGYISSPSFTKRSKGAQFIFLNNRFILNKSLNHSVYRAYEHLLEKGDFPFFILFIQINSAKIDINVHPAKLEVKFDDEGLIYSLVYNCIKDTLSNYSFIPNINLNPDDSNTEKISFNKVDIHPKTFTDDTIKKYEGGNRFTYNNFNQSFTSTNNKLNAGDILYQKPEIDITKFEDKKEFEIPSDKLFTQRAVWQLHNKYILTPIKNGLLIIDQHVAHERILYEKTINSLNSNLHFAQQLLFPEEMELKFPDFKLINEMQFLLEQIGFDYKIKPPSSIILYGVPQEIKPTFEKETLLDILEMYRENISIGNSDVKDNLAKSYACKTAIKSGDLLTEKEMLSIIDNLFACKIPNVCPHGRPILIKLTVDELDRRFGRTVQ